MIVATRNGCYHESRSGEFVSESLNFDVDCPNNHNQTITFAREQFEKSLKSGGLVFHCNTCDTDWSPTHEEIAKFQKEFAKNPT